MKLRLDHIGVAVKDLEESLEKWQQTLELELSGIEGIEERGVRVAQLDFENGPSIELISALGEDSAVKRFLDERGEGIHHFCFEVDDIHRTIKELKEKGIQFIEPVPVKGTEESMIAFIHPDNLNNVLIEFKEKKK